ncbi:Cleavage and polyadenylation specificity factor 73 [Eumeta japonica]|uniref:Cleavage and polyadenylation specificity factor 73 n=1 Tax=Eumeta variegata TaxID=151549 RepID=A0A4C1UHA6_EUMVA|nr:Cleavage and polyadenylation specificity factor 73 [Eumeta japonica]
MTTNPRKAAEPAPMEESDQLTIRPLGAGQEVGRSCIMLEFKGKKIMLDCGIHPGLSGMDALPFVDLIEADEVDLLLISHNISTEQMLYTESDLESSMDRIETINFHEEKDVRGVKFWAYNAGHVLGAAMFMIEIAGVKNWCCIDGKMSRRLTENQIAQIIHDFSDSESEGIEDGSREHFGREDTSSNSFTVKTGSNGAKLHHIHLVLDSTTSLKSAQILYTGDFSRQEDRHLMAAEIPTVHPDVLITESTYGTHIHEKREERESRFTSLVSEIVQRGGRCLIPVFALGRAQELLLILDEYWSLHPELQDIPIYYASSLAKKCMAVYQTYINAMNDRIRRQIAINNPFVFRHISNLKLLVHFYTNKLKSFKLFGFTWGRSTIDGGIELVQHNFGAWENSRDVIGVFCDHSKAFDCVYHETRDRETTSLWSNRPGTRPFEVVFE